MDDAQLLRYSRQIMLPQIDVAGQEKLRGSSVLIVGLGGLGSPAALYLAAAGVGHLLLADDDSVDLSNLQRQILHTQNNIGQAKTQSAIAALEAINPDTRLTAINSRLQGDVMETTVEQADVIVDASDNFATRFALNQACLKFSKPLVSGAVIRMEGQITVFDCRRADSPCYRCLYPDMVEIAETCSENGVLAPVVGIIGSIQATETIKLLLQLGNTLTGRLLLLDAMTMEWRNIALPRDPACPSCGQ
ncbi:MAG TPA: molybdopterin-synthase adenylyltransferase MoeB [Acidiferrobacteraceae bacterium]|nr:molybdopterin-synthase adenylyltransferase MoeB [Acidiferrobacteraceae bacterium]HEX20098.1 molybdopterin-synthase adenylyltransferase MoeB [Acidiferrobacteraceae bacterium]